jgi:hypothetical protein
MQLPDRTNVRHRPGQVKASGALPFSLRIKSRVLLQIFLSDARYTSQSKSGRSCHRYRELLSLEIEDGRAKDDRYVDATTVEYFPSMTGLLSGAPRRQLALPDLARQRQRLADRGALKV